MSKADEMFEKMGYKKIEDKLRILYTYKQMFVHFTILKNISFFKIEKEICFETWNITEGIKISTNITKDELRAINKKYKELG